MSDKSNRASLPCLLVFAGISLSAPTPAQPTPTSKVIAKVDVSLTCTTSPDVQVSNLRVKTSGTDNYVSAHVFPPDLPINRRDISSLSTARAQQDSMGAWAEVEGGIQTLAPDRFTGKYHALAQLTPRPPDRAWARGRLEITYTFRLTNQSPTERNFEFSGTYSILVGLQPHVEEEWSAAANFRVDHGVDPLFSKALRTGNGLGQPPDEVNVAFAPRRFVLGATEVRDVDIKVDIGVTATRGREDCRLLLGLSPGSSCNGSDCLLVQPLLQYWVTLSDIPRFPIPSEPSILGTVMYAQIYMDNAMSFPDDPIQLSNGLRIVFGHSTAPYGNGGSGISLWASTPPLLGSTLILDFHIPGA